MNSEDRIETNQTSSQSISKNTSSLFDNTKPESKPSLHTSAMASKETKDFNTTSYSSVVKLSNGTFNDWKLRLTTILGAQRLSNHILQDIEPPTDPSALDDHETHSLRALAAIHATIDDENFQVIRSCTSPREAFQKLCKHHDNAGGLSTAHLFSDLVTTKMGSDDDLSEHLHQFRTIHNDLLSNLHSTPDIKISEPFIAIILINSLPSEYTPLVQTLLANFETLTLTRLYSLLKIEATRNNSTAKKDTALSASRLSSKPKYEKKKDHFQENSAKCSLGHPGHTDENCRVRRFRAFVEYEKKLKSEESSSKSKNHVAQVAQSSVDAEVHPSYWESAFSATNTSTIPTFGDTGATSHMFSDRSKITDLQPIPPTRIGVASKDGAIWTNQKGKVSFGSMTLTDVLYSSKLTGNLISIGRLCDEGYRAVFDRYTGIVSDAQGRVVLRMSRSAQTNHLWAPITQPPPSMAFLTSSNTVDIARLWHKRLGHLHPDAVIHFLRQRSSTTLSRRDFLPCDDCAMGKLTQSPSTSSFHRSPHILNLVHSDILGPISPATKSGMKYIISFIDDHSRYTKLYLLKCKSQAFEAFKQYKTLMENKFGVKIQKLKSDRGGEYSSNAFINFLKQEGIEEEKGPAQRPTADSVAERYFRTLLGKMRSQLIQAGLPLSLWGELALYCSIQINCSPSTALNHQSPSQVFESFVPGHLHPFDENRLKPFGCLCFAADRDRKGKFTPVARRFIFVGLEHGARAARLWDKATGRIFVTGDVIYQEDIFPALHPTLSPNVAQELTFPSFHDECRIDTGSTAPSHLSPSPPPSQSSPSSPSPPSSPSSPSLPSLPSHSSSPTPQSSSSLSPPHSPDPSPLSQGDGRLPNPTVSPEPSPYRPRELIPLSASIHAPRIAGSFRNTAQDRDSDGSPSPLALSPIPSPGSSPPISHIRLRSQDREIPSTPVSPVHQPSPTPDGPPSPIPPPAPDPPLVRT